MGLDAVELVMEVEEEFGVTIPDEAAGYMVTLGQLHDFLLEANGVQRRSGCLTQKAFYRIRRALVDTLGVEQRSIRPSTPILPLLGKSDRWKKWRHIGQALSLRLPELMDRTGAGVAWGGLIGAMSALLLALALTGDPWVGAVFALMGVAPGMLVGWLVSTICRPIPAFATVGELSRYVVALNSDEFRTPDEPPTTGDPIWERLCGVVARELHVSRESLTRRTEFAKDLGC